jgi:hypothetical protein
MLALFPFVFLALEEGRKWMSGEVARRGAMG